MAWRGYRLQRAHCLPPVTKVWPCVRTSKKLDAMACLVALPVSSKPRASPMTSGCIR